MHNDLGHNMSADKSSRDRAAAECDVDTRRSTTGDHSRNLYIGLQHAGPARVNQHKT